MTEQAKIQVSAPAVVEMPASTAGRKADLPFEHSVLEVGQSVFVPGKENEKVVRRVFNNARRTYGKNGAPKLDGNGEQRISPKGKPLFYREFEREFTVRYIEDGKAYNKKFAGLDGYALFRIK